MSTAVIRELEEVNLKRERGGRGQIKPEDKPGPGFRGIGVLYCKELGEGQVELKVLFEAHVSQPIRDALAERFGCGAKEWKVTED